MIDNSIGHNNITNYLSVKNGKHMIYISDLLRYRQVVI